MRPADRIPIIIPSADSPRAWNVGYRILAFASAIVFVLLSSAVPAAAPAGGESMLLDFSASWCGPCQQMMPVVNKLERQGYPIHKVDVDQQPQLASRFKISSIPTFVLIVDGKEVNRITGLTSENQLRRLLMQIPQAEADPPIAQVEPRLGSPQPLPTEEPRREVAAGESESRPGFRLPWMGRGEKTADVSDERPLIRANNADGVAASRPRTDDPIGASVRIRVREEGGVNFGSGTIIDSQVGRTIILTCGHIFRRHQHDSAIEVDVFAPGGRHETFVGQVLRYDLESDVGLIAIPTAEILPASNVASGSYRVATADDVFSIGCGGGEPPSREDLRVTALNRYLGPDNIECTGEPIQGRSGGGLFNAAGDVVGVCIAADPREKRGLYAGLQAVQALLDQSELTRLYETSEPAAVGVAVAEEAASFANSPSPQTAAVDAADASPEVEQLKQLLETPEAEVICIVRPINDPRAASRVVILNRASSKFVSYLLDEVDEQASRRTASMRLPLGDERGVDSGRWSAAPAGPAAAEPVRYRRDRSRE